MSDYRDQGLFEVRNSQVTIVHADKAVVGQGNVVGFDESQVARGTGNVQAQRDVGQAATTGARAKQTPAAASTRRGSKIVAWIAGALMAIGIVLLVVGVIEIGVAALIVGVVSAAIAAVALHRGT